MDGETFDWEYSSATAVLSTSSFRGERMLATETALIMASSGTLDSVLFNRVEPILCFALLISAVMDFP